MVPGCGGKANYRCNKCNVVWAQGPGAQAQLTGVTSVTLCGPQGVVGRHNVTGVNNVTLCLGPDMWGKANYRCNKCNVVWAQDVVGRPTYRCNKCNVVWAQDVVGRPTTGVTSVTLCGPRMWWEGQLHV